MDDITRQFTALRSLPAQEIFVTLFDVGLVAYLIYRLLMLVRGTRAWRIFIGIVAFIFLLFLSDRLNLNTLHWILEKATILGPVALVILFLPELRQAIEGIGKITPLQILEFAPPAASIEARTVEEITNAVTSLAQQSVGALIVIEKTAKLDEIVANGVPLNAQVSSPLLGSIFYGENPLHDGAVILRADKILAAACRLPLSESVTLDPNVHMRHRAAVGVTEVTDAFVIVVSEERGSISIASDGVLTRLESPQALREFLNRELRKMAETTPQRKSSRLGHRDRSKNGTPPEDKKAPEVGAKR